MSERLTWRINNHVAVCRSCADVVASVASISSLLGASMKHEVSTRFDTALESKISALPKRANRNRPLLRFFRSLRGDGSAKPISLRRVAAPIAVAFVFAAFALQVMLGPTTNRTTPARMPSANTQASEPNLVDTCIVQHRTAAGEDPLGDTSALILSTSVDALPVSPNENQSLSDDDAAVLLEQEL